MSFNDKSNEENNIIFEEAIAGALFSMGFASAAILPFIDQQTLDSLYNWSFNIPAYGVAGAIALAGFIGFQKLGFQVRRWHLSGTQYFEKELEGKYELQAAETREMTAKQKNGTVSGWKIGGVNLSRTREVGHLLIVGLPGSGKTVIINDLLIESVRRKDKIILHDPKGDFTTWLYNPKDTVMLGPWDKRAKQWDISKDLDDAGKATSFANVLVEGTNKGNAQMHAFYGPAARSTIAGLIKYLMVIMEDEWSWDNLSDYLKKGGIKLIQTAQLGDPTLELLISEVNQQNKTKDMGETTKNILASVAVATEWIVHYSAAFKVKRLKNGRLDRENADMFSIVDYLRDDYEGSIKKVILNNNALYPTFARQILGAVIACAIGFLNSPQKKQVHFDEPGVAIILDEFIQLGKGLSEAIITLEELGRSKNIRVAKGIQDKSQTTAQLGQDVGAVQTSMQSTVVYCRLSQPMASATVKALGSKEVYEISVPIDGAGNKRRDTKQVPVLHESEFTGLLIHKAKDEFDNPVGPQGVEIIMQIGDKAAKLLHPFADRALMPTIAEQLIENYLWKNGPLMVASKIMGREDFNEEGHRIGYNADDLIEDASKDAEDQLKADAKDKIDQFKEDMNKSFGDLISMLDADIASLKEQIYNAEFAEADLV